MPADGGGWDVTGPNDASVVSHHPTQAEGIEAAAALAAGAGGGEVVIHGRDGKPRDTRRISPPDGSS